MSIQVSKYTKVSIGLILFVISMYIAKYTSILRFIDSTLLQYWILPGAWLIVIILLYTKLPRIHGVGKLKFNSIVYMWAFNCGVAFVGISLLGGVVQGFGKSPYSHSLKGILMNCFLAGTALVGREQIRAYLVNTFGKRTPKVIYLVILFMAFTNINWWGSNSFQDFKSTTIFLAEQVGPELFENILATYLVLYGGPLASSIYLGMVEAFEWLFPILPNLDWLAKCIIGVSVPLVAMIFVSSHYLKLTKAEKSYTDKEESLWHWLPTAVICIVWIWFTVGVFPIYPSAIATGSMEPMIYPGDVVLVDKMDRIEELEALKVGDVIQFKRDTILINHRIIEIVEEDGQKLYRTKGDNNSAEDRELVKMEDVKGTIIHVIPKLGWPTLIFKSDNLDILSQVEF